MGRIKKRSLNNLSTATAQGVCYFATPAKACKVFPKRIYHPIALPQPKQYETPLKPSGHLVNIPCNAPFTPNISCANSMPIRHGGNFDPRVQWLIDFLKQHRQEKVFVICRYAGTAIQLEQILREKEGIRSAVFHEKMSIVERDRAAAYFTQQENGAQVLLSSNIGSEGRNFQFASRLVLFNLPENPDLLEQCIGRLDRIGQTKEYSDLFCRIFTERRTSDIWPIGII